MWEKAMMFNDTEIASKILASNEPSEQKKLGRKVRGFDSDIWNSEAISLVTEICYAKFSQNEELKDVILSFKGKTFVEASPYDKIWGIGLGEMDSRCDDESTWQGANWLGVCLNIVRNRLQPETSGDYLQDVAVLGDEV